MPDLKPHRLYGITIKDSTTKQVCVPEYEIGIVKAAWRGKEIDITETADTREVLTDSRIVFNDLLRRYSAKAVAQFYPGPERLEQDMQASADKTAAYLAKINAEAARRASNKDGKAA
jgi:hypothetical protein